MEVIALLPMKAHSERVSNKNIRLFAGLPLFHRVAEILEQSRYVKTIIINTDSPEIAENAVQHFTKACINKRPAELCGDKVPMNDIIAYDIDPDEGEYFLQTHSTNPLLTLETLEKAIETFFASLEKFDSLFSVTRYQTRFYWPDGKAVNHNPEELLRTQDLPPLYEENSNFFIFSKTSFVNAGKKRIGMKPRLFEINRMEAVDIDEPEDWDLAEMIFKMRHEVQCK